MRYIFLILLIISADCLGQTKLYAIRGNLDGTKDSFYVHEVAGNGIYNSAGHYVAPKVDSILNIQGLAFPLSFGTFFKCADQIYRNPIALYGVKTETIVINANAAANLVLTDHPNSEQPLVNSQRSSVRVQTHGYTEVRLTAIVIQNSASVNNPRIYFQYSTDGVNWIGSGNGISLSTNGAKETGWVEIPAGAIGDVYLRVAQNGGNGSADPSLGTVTIQFR